MKVKQAITLAVGSFSVPLKPNGDFVDPNCCAVVALINAFGDRGIGWTTARHHCRKYGRPDGQGMAANHWHRMLKEVYGAKFVGDFGTTYNAIWIKCYLTKYEEGAKSHPGITLGKFMEKYNKGTYLLMVTGHFTVVKDGELYDDGDPGYNKSVQGVWKV